MSLLIPVKYHSRNYPRGIHSNIEEISGHFAKPEIKPIMDYSLHTEYSYSPRKLDSDLLKELPVIQNSHKKLVPQLWKNNQWAKEFSRFIKKLVGKNIPPKIIEIHPPFNDYCSSIGDFLRMYTIFEHDMLQEFPEIEIVIENRYGTMYSGGRFLIATNEELLHLYELLKNSKLKLDIVLDIPQLFTAHNITPQNMNEELIQSILSPLKVMAEKIAGIHVWGKKRSKNGRRLVSHIGDLNTYCNNKQDLKNRLLSSLFNILNDDRPRYFVPEVNSGDDDLFSIVNDFKEAGFKFI
jgi:hypothetical protein